MGSNGERETWPQSGEAFASLQAPLGCPPGGGKAPAKDPVDHCNVIMS